MAIEIRHMRDDVAAPSNLTIEPVHDERGLEDWVSVWLFPVPAAFRASAFNALRERGLGDGLPWRYFICRIGGTPVACSELFVDLVVAAVHYVVTLPNLRRRGIGAAMTLCVLREARDRGYGVAVLTASPDGRGIY